MQISKRRATVIATALLLGGACVASQPAIAKDPTGSIDSREILNKTIRGKDLKPGLLAKINLGATALQEIPDGSVTTQKLADDAVTGPKLANNSVGASEVTNGTIGASELAPNSVGADAVANSSLTALDIADVRGVNTLNYASIPGGSCLALQVDTGAVLDNDIILVTPGPTMPGIITINARQAQVGSTNIAFVACNGANVALDPGAVPFSWAVIEN